MVGGQRVFRVGILGQTHQNVGGAQVVARTLGGLVQQLVTHLSVNQILLCILFLVGGPLLLKLLRRVQLQRLGFLHFHAVVLVKLQILAQVCFRGIVQRAVLLVSLDKFGLCHRLIAHSHQHRIVVLSLQIDGN